VRCRPGWQGAVWKAGERQAARSALIQALFCRENLSANGLGGRHAGAAIDADAFLPNMATEAFLPAPYRAALEQCAAATAVATQVRVKDTRAALIANFAAERSSTPALFCAVKLDPGLSQELPSVHIAGRTIAGEQ
jgi:ParB family chromosome partitioning protein